MRSEHEHAQPGDAMARPLELTDAFMPRPNACNTHRALLAGLVRLETDLHEHGHKENNVRSRARRRVKRRQSPDVQWLSRPPKTGVERDADCCPNRPSFFDQRMMPGRVLLFFAFASLAAGALQAQGQPDYEQPPLSYSATAPHDAITRLQERIAGGELAFTGTDRKTLQAVLDALGVSTESQILVFSKTSLQRGRIRPDRPRALYFSENAYVGWVPGGLIEVVAIDPQLGPVFYSVEAEGRNAAPKIERTADCLRCHGGTFVREIPGVLARSVFPDDGGEPMLRHGSLVVDDETPFEQRWGGWYVTGYHGQETHRGNVRGSESGDQLVFEPEVKRPDELSTFFDTSAYLRSRSDVVALLVFEHQLTMQNALTRAGLMCRKMIAYQHGLQKAFKDPITDEPAYDSVKSVFNSSVQDVVDRLLFRHAAPLPAGVDGSDAFKAAFARNAPRSPAGHALKDLRLDGRIFANRCSYLIYSDAFRALPDTLRTRVLDRLHAALLSRDPKDRYAYLAADEKQRILEILIATLPEAAARWKTEAVAAGAGASAP